ncbi:MAG: isochorismatase family protein [Pseudomonadota bacterium]
MDRSLPGHLKITESQLVVVDVQGRLARLMYESDTMIRAQQILIEACRLLDVPIVWAEQLPDKLGLTVDELQKPLHGLTPLEKSSFGCWGDDVLRYKLQTSGRNKVLLCGIEAHVCVWQTAAALQQNDFEVHVITDACSSRSAFNRDIAYRRMQSAGIYLSSVEMALFELMNNAHHPQFRAVSQLLK